MATASISKKIIDTNETAAINVQVNAQKKMEATKILSQLGVSMSSFINMAINQVVIQKGIPFEVTTEERFSKELLEALEEADQLFKEIKEGKRKGYNSVDKMFEDILNEDN